MRFGGILLGSAVGLATALQVHAEPKKASVVDERYLQFCATLDSNQPYDSKHPLLAYCRCQLDILKEVLSEKEIDQLIIWHKAMIEGDLNVIRKIEAAMSPEEKKRVDFLVDHFDDQVEKKCGPLRKK